jgi:hypothetical protein
LKKGRRALRAAQKTFVLCWSRDVETSLAQIKKSLFGFAGGQPFSSEKELLPS